MKIGDIVLNHHAGLKNPYRISMYIGMSGKYRKCLCADGHISHYEKDANLEVVGHLPFKDELQKEWLVKSAAQKTTNKSDYAKCPKKDVTENSCHAYEGGYCKFALKTDDFA